VSVMGLTRCYKTTVFLHLLTVTATRSCITAGVTYKAAHCVWLSTSLNRLNHRPISMPVTPAGPSMSRV